MAHRAIGVVLIVAGAAVAANAIVSGPRAFGSGMLGVVATLLSGLALIGAGLWSVVRSTAR